jgi:hypothetical protein
MVEKRDTDAGHVVVLHPVDELHRGGRLAFDHHGGQQPILNVSNVRGGVVF